MRKITTTLLICFATIVATAQTAKIYDAGGNHNLGYGYSGDGGPAVGAQLGIPEAITFDAAGNMYIADGGNGVIRMVNTAGTISTVAGNYSLGNGYAGDGGLATDAELSSNITGVAVDGTGNLYIADAGNSVVRMVNTAGIISTFAGGGTMGDYNVQASDATLNGIAGLAYSNNTAAFGANGALFITETGGVYSRVLYVTLNNSLLTILGGAGTPSNTGDGGAVDAAQFNTPRGMAFDALGNLYVADAGNNRIRVVTASSLSPGNWIVSNFAGNAGGASGFSGDGGQATAAKLQQPYAVTVDLNGNVYIADNGYSCIRKVNTSGIISVITATSTPAFGGYNGDAIIATTAKLNGPTGVTCDALGNIYIADYENNEVREITTSCIPPTIIAQPKDTTVCPGNQAGIWCNYINYTGYQWQINSGSGFVNHTVNYSYSGGSMDTIQNPSIPMSGWQYQCIVKGCSNITSHAATLTITSPTITCNAPIICAGSAASATLTASGATTGSYTWSTGDNTDYIVETPTVTITYTVMGTDLTGTGCSGTGMGTITVLQPQVPAICEITTDSTTNYKYNYIYWDASAYSRVDTFIIYRYDAGSGNYLKIGSRAKDSLSVYIDKDSTIGGPHGGNPAYASWKYKLAIKDSCGNIGAKGPYHQSIFVQQTGQNFSWTAYVDSGITTLPTGYAFLRDSLGIGDYHVLANVSATASSDPNYTSYPNAVYRVDALGFSCTPTTGRLSGNNSVDAAKVKSHSNTNNNRVMTTGLKQLATNNQITIYPNPNNGNFDITSSESTKAILVTDVLGNELISVSPNNTSTHVNLSAQPNGIYFIKVISDNSQTVKRVIINN